MDLVVDLPRSPRSVGLARRAVRDRFGQALTPREHADVALIVSELVTNALEHGRGEIALRLQLDDDVLRGEVVDTGDGFEAEVREAGVSEVRGRGLRIVGSIADRWGIHEGSSHVWFELVRPGAGPLTPPELGEHRRPPEL